MTFTGLSAGAVAAIGGVASAVALLLYLLRPRQRALWVPFFAFWQDALGKERPTAWLRKLRGLLGLLLILAMLWLVTASLGRPVVGRASSSPALVVVLDAGASMTASSGDDARIDEARRQARVLVRTSAAPEVALLAFDADVRIVSPFAASRRELLRALAAVRATECPSDLHKALDLAGTLAASRGARIVVVGDDGTARQFGDVPAMDRVGFVKVGEAAGNLAITAFAMRPSFAAAATEYETMVRVANYSDDPRSITLRILAQREDREELIDAVRVTLAPRGEKTLFFPSFDQAGGTIVARLCDDEGRPVQDALKADNEARVHLPFRSPLRVLLVTAGNRFLESALAADSRVLAYKASPQEPIDAEGFDVVVLDGDHPLPADARTVVMLPRQEDLARLDDEQTILPGAIEPVGDHPVFGGLPIRDVFVARARRLPLEPGDVVLARGADGEALMVERNTPDGRRFVFAFDPCACEWPLRAAFPLFWGNLMRVASGAWMHDPFISAPCGQTLTVRAPAGVTEATLQTPDGARERLSVRNGVVNAALRQPGMYVLSGADEAVTVASNLLSAEESDLSAGDSPDWVRRLPSLKGPGSRVRLGVYGLWKVLVVAALALLVVEFYTFTRRWTV